MLKKLVGSGHGAALLSMPERPNDNEIEHIKGIGGNIHVYPDIFTKINNY